ncbi:MAG: hydrogenase maturation nickel metallochaperone HypA [Coriobacteriales bacterium]|jgi:hydrogenase nickel incorporation protein HypA/HybF|nr:hydrogenase maturation nickel metallochaperone HypA [Coriobacteriales bacterium]
MHEMSLMTSVLETADETARKSGAKSITRISLTVGVMSDVLSDALEFAFEVLSPESPYADGAELVITQVTPRSRCQVCGLEFDHDRFHRSCPSCQALATELLAGRELFIESIEVENGD